MSGSRFPRIAGVAILAAALAVGAPRLAAQDAPPPALDRDLAALAVAADAGDVDVWVHFASQPATRIAEELRPGYDRLIDSARAPALAALARIEPLLPPREERLLLGVGGVMARERELLTPQEIDAVRASHAETLRLLAEMRARILDDAKPLCDAEQTPVAAWIETLPGGRVETRTVVLNALIARVPAAALPDLARAFPGVARIARAGKCDVSLNTSVPTIGAANWTSNGYAGGGEKVAVVDTGVDSSHPAFTRSNNSAVVTNAAVRVSTGQTYDPYFNDNASSTDDFHGHGTHCCGIVASNDSTNTGVAPGASLMGAKALYHWTNGGSSGASGYDADIVAATDWALTNGANVLSCSFGGGSSTTDGSYSLSIFYDAVAEVSGAAVAIAAGNTGGNATINLPGDGFNCVTVGAFGDNDTTTLSDDFFAQFTSRGPTSDGRRKPDLSAPGYNVNSTNAFWEGSSSTSDDFVGNSGTSMATPHVAGAMALLLSYTTSWKPESLKALLANSCRNTSPITGAPDVNWGCGALDVGQAYVDRTRLASATFTTSGPVAHYYKLGAVASGARSTIAWNRAAGYLFGNPANGGGAAKTLVNLDLYLYDGSNGQQSAASASSVDNLEQVAAASALTSGVVKVLRAGSFPSGKTSQIYALATGANSATATNPPTLSITSTSAPTDLAGNTQFTFQATVQNTAATGDLRAPTPTLTLTLPAGFTFVSGSTAAQSVASLDPAGSATAAWTVRTGTSSGSFQFSVSASSTGYGDTFTSSAATRSMTVDAAAPVVNAGPDFDVFATSAAGRSVALSGSATDANSAKGLTYEWDTDGDGLFNDTPGSATGASPTVVFPIGARTVTLRVTDYVGNVGTDTASVVVRDNPPTANAGVDKSSNEGSSVSFDGAASSDVEAAVASFSWNWGDGSSATSGAAPAHVFRDEGQFTVTLTVTDSAGQTAVDTALVTVSNVAPTAGAGAAKSGDEGSSVTFVGSASDPGPDDVLTYSWTFGDGASGVGASPSHVYRDEGGYTATLTVTDGDGGSSVSTTTATISNVAPTANAGAAKSGNEGSSVTFGGSAIDPGLDDVLTYSWTFGDGGTGSGTTPSHVYRNQGSYTATLTVTDGDGGTSVSTTTATIANVAPTADAGSARSGAEGAAIVFAGSGADAGPDDVLTYSWTFGDGATGSGATPSHVYVQNGSYTATLTVRDADGGIGQSDVAVAVANVAPTANAGGAKTGDEGSAISFAGSATDPGASDVLGYAWDFGDGAVASGASVAHVYVQNGSYTATLTVVDGDGGVATSTAQVTVRNAPPVAHAGSDASSDEGDAVAFAGTASDAGANDALTYAWDFGDGGAATTAEASHVYAQDGVYAATFTVTDDAGASSSSARTITVGNLLPEVAAPDSLTISVGDVLHLTLAPTDASPIDAAALVVDWRVLDAAGAFVAAGAGADVLWPADRKLAGTLVVNVADDDGTTTKIAPLTATTPVVGATLAAALAQQLDAATEKKVLLDLLSARAAAANPKKLKAAGKTFTAAKTLLAKKGVTTGPLVARLAVLAADAAAGAAPPAEPTLEVPSETGSIDDLLAAAPAAGFAEKTTAKLLAALVDLRFAQRGGASKKIEAARKKALAVVAKAPVGPARDWFQASIAVL